MRIAGVDAALARAAVADDVEAGVLVPAGPGQRRGRARKLHAGKRGQAIDQAHDVGGSVRLFGIGGRRQRDREGQHAFGVKAGIRLDQRDETARQQAGGDQQGGGDRDLRDHQAVPQPRRVTSGARAAAAVAHQALHVGARGVQRGNQSEDQRRRAGERGRERQDAPVEMNHVQARKVLRHQSGEHARADDRERESEHAAEHGQQETFRQDLADQAARARAEREADGHLAAADDRAREQQAGDVRAANQQDGGRGGDEHHQE